MFGGVDADVAHVANVENPYGAADGIVFGDETAAGRILDGHVPATKIDHFGAQTAVQRVQGRLAKDRICRRSNGFHSDGSGQQEMLAREVGGVKTELTERMDSKGLRYRLAKSRETASRNCGGLRWKTKRNVR